jgi:hypothetical protein
MLDLSYRVSEYTILRLDPPSCDSLWCLQIYDIAARNSDTDTQFRLTIADGYDLQRAVLAPVLNDMVQNMMLVIKPGSIVRIVKYTLHASVHQKLKR